MRIQYKWENINGKKAKFFCSGSLEGHTDNGNYIKISNYKGAVENISSHWSHQGAWGSHELKAKTLLLCLCFVPLMQGGKCTHVFLGHVSLPPSGCPKKGTHTSGCSELPCLSASGPGTGVLSITWKCCCIGVCPRASPADPRAHAI